MTCGKIRERERQCDSKIRLEWEENGNGNGYMGIGGNSNQKRIPADTAQRCYILSGNVAMHKKP